MMVRSRTLPAALAAALVLGIAGGAALAQSSQQQQQQQQQQRGRHGERENGAEMAAVLGARVAPADAVAAAERAANGRAVKLSMESENGTRLYEVRVAAADRMVAVKIDPDTGLSAARSGTGCSTACSTARTGPGSRHS